MNIFKTDIQVSDHVWLARSLARFPVVGYLYRDLSEQFQNPVSYIMDNIYPSIDRTDLKIRIAPIRSENSGESIFNFVQIDPRPSKHPSFTIHENIRTLIHELCHVDQTSTGRLKYQGADTIWCGTTFDTPLHPTIKEYTERPWEVEARGAEQLYLPSIMERIENDAWN